MGFYDLMVQVVDSPFAKLTDLMTELVAEQKLPIPRPFMRVAISMMRRSVKKRAGFSIDDVAPLDFVGDTHVPVLFGESHSFISLCLSITMNHSSNCSG